MINTKVFHYKLPEKLKIKLTFLKPYGLSSDAPLLSFYPCFQLKIFKLPLNVWLEIPSGGK